MANLHVTVEPDSQNIVGVANIKAPLEKVFRAYTDPTLFGKWFGRGHETEVHVFDARTGGEWHIDEITPDGSSYGFRGSFHEIANNERIIWTFEFLGLPDSGHVSFERIDFARNEDGSTELHTTSTFFNVEDRDAMVNSGMETGWLESLQALEKLTQE